ncbi:MAG: type II toxin-antitoxin system HicA family toxin [Desulfovibrionaceae bacterium]
MNSREVIARLEAEGWTLMRRTSGSHRVYRKGERVVVVAEHKGKDIPKGTLNRIMKDAGWK